MDHDTTTSLLDPQLLVLQPSPQHMLLTPFTTAGDHNQLTSNITGMDQSPESFTGASPFIWNDFTFFDKLNHSLGILNPTDDIQNQLDQLISNVVPSGIEIATAWPSSPSPNNNHNLSEAPNAASRTSAALFRIPASNEVHIKEVHSAPPMSRNIEKKLDEAAWKGLVHQAELSEAVR